MKLQHDTIIFYIEDALDEINEILARCRDKQLEDQEFYVLMDHALKTFNCAYNSRYLSRKESSQLKQEDWEEYLRPPEEIFGKD